jgi:putative FmdB family regulatory protein
MEEAAMGADASHLYSPAAMPIYEYRCENGHLFEVMQKITEDPVTVCPECGATVQRVFHPIAVHFKGSGFYNTDYGTAKRKREMDRSAASGADKHDAKQAEKRESKSSSDGGSPSKTDTSSSSGSSGSSGSSSSGSGSGSGSGSSS